MSLTRAWQEEFPDDDNFGYELDDYQRQIRKDVRERLAVQHQAYLDETGHTDVGEHKPGECTVSYIGLKSAFPVPATTTKGCIAIATDEANQQYYWTGTAWAEVQDVVLMTGDQTIAGAKTFSNIATLADESLMASSAAPTTDAMIANKKYVDDSIPAAFDPSPYIGGESCEIPNGFIVKMGTANSTLDTEETFTFADAFPTGCVACVTIGKQSGMQSVLPVTSVSAANFKIDRNDSMDGTIPFFWIAIGY